MLKKWFALSTLLSLLVPQVVLAQQQTLLPQGSEDYTAEDCLVLLQEYEDEIYEIFKNPQDESEVALQEELLSCSVKSGKIRVWMLPYFIKYFANFFIGIAGTVSLLFTVLGGFWYMTGGATDDKEKGKKTITYALIGLSITLLAWIAVNIIQTQITG